MCLGRERRSSVLGPWSGGGGDGIRVRGAHVVRIIYVVGFGVVEVGRVRGSEGWEMIRKRLVCFYSERRRGGDWSKGE